MSHEIENGNAFFVGEKAWHGVGKMFDRNNPPKTAREAMIAAGADWRVELYPQFTEIPMISDDPTEIVTTKRIEVPGQFAVIRDIDGKVLGSVGAKYEPLQNESAFNFFNPFILNGEATFEAGGVLNGGSKIWALAKINEGAHGEVIDGDLVNTYLCLFTSHDGSTSVGILFTPVRVVCQNTLFMAIRSSKVGQNMVKVPHTKSMHKSLEVVQNSIDTARKSFTVTLEQFRLMQEKKITVEGLAEFATFAIHNKNEKVKQDELTRVVKQVMEFYEEGVGQQIDGVQGNLWGAYNAVTGWVDHVRGRSPDTRLNASWFGEGSNVRNRAHKIALDVVSGDLSLS